MLTMSGNFVRTIWLLLITLVAVIYRSAGEPSQLIVCSQPDNFTVQITENERVVVYGTELLIRYNPPINVFSFHPERNIVNVVFNESTVQFKAYMLPEFCVTLSCPSPERIALHAEGIVFGICTVTKISTEDYVFEQCQPVLPFNIKTSANVQQVVKDQIIHYAQNCIKVQIYQKIKHIKANEIRDINTCEANLIPFSLLENYQKEETCSTDEGKEQLNINAPVKMALNSAIDYIMEHNQSVIQIPEISKSYKLGPLTAAHFEATGGTFQDLSTLHSTENAILSSVGKTHVAQAGIGLSLAMFSFDHYQIKVGFVGISGKIVGTVEGLALSLKVTVSCDETCVVHFDHAKVTQFGKLKLEMTGLGPLNHLTSNFLSWMTQLWQGTIAKLIESNVKHVAQEQIKIHICKTFANELDLSDDSIVS